MTKRALSLDVLRGLAILGMVLSGTISRNSDLPAWLFHAQIAPPDFVFNPQLPGITWVDLVFPFFLFAMGMAFPFSFRGALQRGASKGTLVRKIIFRGMKLVFFAILLGHLSPFHYPESLGGVRYLMGLIAFMGFMLTFSSLPWWKNWENWLNMQGILLLVGLLVVRVWVLELPFSIHRNDIIILVLANMAIFGSLIWLFTPNNWYVRLGIMALYFAFRLTSGVEDSWNQVLWNFTPLKWIGMQLPAFSQALASVGIETSRTIFYHPNFLKYLLIVLPGTIAGDMLYAYLQRADEKTGSRSPKAGLVLALMLLGLLAFNLWGLFSRQLVMVLFGNIAGFVAIHMLSRSFSAEEAGILRWSIFWLLLGLAFEAFESGVKKDHATMSYFFITSGLAGYMVICFNQLAATLDPQKTLGFIGLTGMNPMLGYVAAAYAVMPLLYFAGLLPWMDQWHQYWPWAGFLRGVVLTGLMVLLTVYSVKLKCFWKT